MSVPTPKTNTLVDITHEGNVHASRVLYTDGLEVAVAAPLDSGVEPPELADLLSLRWSAGARGRYVADVRLRSTARGRGMSAPSWVVAVEGIPGIEQRRQFVRAGGGEPVQLVSRHRLSDDGTAGHVIDISEGGLRCWFPYISLSPGERVLATVNLDDEILCVEGSVIRSDEDIARRCFITVVMYDLNERDSDFVRRYVIRQQILARRAAADAAS